MVHGRLSPCCLACHPAGAPAPNATFFCTYNTFEPTRCYYYYNTMSTWFEGNTTCAGLSGVLFQPKVTARAIGTRYTS